MTSTPATLGTTENILCQQAEALVRQGKNEEALPLLNQVLACDKDNAQAHKWIGAIYVEQGERTRDIAKLMEAIPYLEEARKTLSDDIEVLFPLGIALMTLGHHDDATDCFARTLIIQPNHWPAFHRQALTLTGLRKYDAALAHLDSAIQLKPDFADAYLHKAMLLERMNRPEEARSVIESAQQVIHNHPALLTAQAKLDSRLGNIERARKTFNTLLASGAFSGVEEAFIRNELAKLHERAAEYKEAFAQFSAANNALASTTHASHVDKNILPERYRHYEKYFTPERLAKWQKHPPPAQNAKEMPVFLTGFPRSGTTLLEQVCAAHPDIFTTQEQPFIDRLTEEVGRDYPEALDSLGDKENTQLRELYAQLVKQQFGTKTKDKTLVDKMPMNMVHLGFISWLFPEAKILTLIRDPRDVVLSCFSQSFHPNLATVHFYALEDVARFYDQVLRLWWQMRDSIKNPTMEIRYEKFVTDVESHTKEICRFLELPWNDAMLSFYAPEQRQTVATPSYEGISQPAYVRSVGRWKHYAEYLKPIEPILAPWIERFGYE